MPMFRIVSRIPKTLATLAICLSVTGLDLVHAQNARASLSAELEFFDPETRRPIKPTAETAVGLRVKLTDVTTGRPPRNLTLAGWIRFESPGNTTCEQAAQAFRVTAEPPVGSVDLNGILLVSVNEDASVGVIDPKLNLRSSNMLAAAAFETMPTDMALHQGSFRAFFIEDSTNGIISFSLLTGDMRRHFETIAVTDVETAGGHQVWIGRQDGQVFAFDAPLAPIPVGSGPVTLRASSEPDNPLLAAISKGGGLLVFDSATGHQVMALPQSEELFDLALLADGTVLTLPQIGQVARFIYPDSPDYSVDVHLGFEAQRIVASPDGRHAIAYTPGESEAVVIDVAGSQVVQPLSLTEGGVTEVSFTDVAAYLLSLDGGFVGLIDLQSVAIGKAAQIQRIDLARKFVRPVRSEGLLVSLWPSPQVLAVSPGTQTGWLLHDNQALGEMPPMDSIRLRGGVPHRVAVIDRSFQEVESGTFETVARVTGGDQELVLTTGIGGMTACLGFRVRGAPQDLRTEVITLNIEPSAARLAAGKDVELTLLFRDSVGDAMAVERAEFLLASLSSSWVGRMTAQRTSDGKLQGSIRLPHPGHFALQPIALPENLALKSAVLLEVTK